MAEDTTIVRYCHGCGGFDDDPRFFDILDGGNAAFDRLYHYRCVPADRLEHHGLADHPLVAAASAGARGPELRKIAADHVKTGA
jgi:hypothetical protein